jgi:sulfide:quinone oxidoreductase
MPAAPQFLDQKVAVCGQLKPSDMPDVAGQGFRTIVNNRPDGEAMFGQPANAELERSAAAAGIAGHFLPITLQTLEAEDVRRFQSVLDGADGPVLAFCASGFRSTLLWAMAQAAFAGEPVESLLQKASAAGQPLDRHRRLIERMQGELSR